MDESIPTKMAVRGILNEIIELADKEKKPSIIELKGIKTIDTLFDYLKKNYSPREHWLSWPDDKELQHLSTQILGVYYDELAYKIGIQNNGILPISASLGMYMEMGSPFCKD